jgi:hypothetical protein
MRIMGTTNQKGKAIEQRPYRRAHFVTPPLLTRSDAIHHMICNTDITQPVNTKNQVTDLIQCDLQKLMKVSFTYPYLVGGRSRERKRLNLFKPNEKSSD